MIAETAGATRLILPDEAATAALGARLAAALRPGDLVALSGGLGAGKSVLARAIVRALLGEPDAIVPSPSYTLVNVYAARAGEVWHADLYRLGGPPDALELGLVEALSHAIVLVEWPERLGADLPARHLEIALELLPGSNGAEPREARATPRGPGWDRALAAIGGDA
ncbi:tRNA (adenosine(37)-N6)-threonylcarbamoyltransferase complex ATPase subunit type 1 TsaE [Limibaculum sp. FT325]|uniref:tRNA (adenosine(37)-N6)-threonylcarbamoyltransferase complex ATPase subunit type 1 TsaE n=1 Tax=Thermohalobaculum sediminis TaxID=2939436 RepID=UPI0020C01DAE|nr:tRNA (adenosine(37)-N6)-threonylcarbamoyltransferase complex ATPase subunit type 1 TsaE [Limibaculum sediminis]MCL5776480.1 tRNA (adenosine(37)-N6)-threonylcarbamoyltransferase complex ATPase subunit type 1 TsaE [Limibaculum sediminis]